MGFVKLLVMPVILLAANVNVAEAADKYAAYMTCNVYPKVYISNSYKIPTLALKNLNRDNDNRLNKNQNAAQAQLQLSGLRICTEYSMMPDPMGGWTKEAANRVRKNKLEELRKDSKTKVIEFDFYSR